MDATAATRTVAGQARRRRSGERVARVLARTFKWAASVAIALILMGLAAYGYAVVSFDTETLPEGYGEVGVVLCAGEQENQPLIVGRGGAESGNAWVRPRSSRYAMVF